MKRIFGAKKDKPKPPTLDEATGRLDSRGNVYVAAETGLQTADWCHSQLLVAYVCAQKWCPNGMQGEHDRFCCRLDEKIRKLDEQLSQHRAQIKKCRPGPAQEAAKRRALQV